MTNGRVAIRELQTFGEQEKKELLFMALLSKNFLLPYVRSNRTSGNFLSLSFMCGAMTKTRASIMGRLSLPRLYGQDGIFKGV